MSFLWMSQSSLGKREARAARTLYQKAKICRMLSRTKQDAHFLSSLFQGFSKHRKGRILLLRLAVQAHAVQASQATRAIKLLKLCLRNQKCLWNPCHFHADPHLVTLTLDSTGCHCIKGCGDTALCLDKRVGQIIEQLKTNPLLSKQFAAT